MLSEFRDRLVGDERARRLLDAILVAARQAGFLRAGGRARTDSTHVLANVRDVNRLELVGETVRVALEVVAEVAPGWIGSRIQPGWEQRYTRRIESSRLPVGAPARTAWGAQTATDGAFLLSEIDADPDAAWIGNLPPVKGLRAIWDQQCVPDGAGRWQLREVRILEGAVHIDTPHDVEARWSTKRSTEWTGYKVHLTETCDADAPRLITQVETTAATLTDLDALNAVHADLEAKGLTPGEHYLDAGYVDQRGDRPRRRPGYRHRRPGQPGHFVAGKSGPGLRPGRVHRRLGCPDLDLPAGQNQHVLARRETPSRNRGAGWLR